MNPDRKLDPSIVAALIVAGGSIAAALIHILIGG
jgi:hypothetical protein